MKNKFIKYLSGGFIAFAIILLALYLYGRYNPSIPILMYHHVNEHRGDLVTITPEAFEKQMAYIKANFNTIHLGELLSYLKEGKRFPPRTCVITFDDGYYDNFAYAYPVLKKYNLKATIFVITSRIGEERYIDKIKDHYETNLEGAIAASCTIAVHDTPLTKRGTGRGAGSFLTWEELKEMEKTGLINIQPHTLTHARYFASSRIRDFNSGDFPWWLPLATGADIRLGLPIYEDQKGLLALRYFDDKFLRNYLARYVAERGGEEFFKSRERQEWFQELSQAVEKYRTKHGSLEGRFEKEGERKKRIREELWVSKKEIETRLNKECLFIAWPWGRYSEELVALARACGYQGAITTQKGANTIKGDPMHLKRFDIKTGNLRWFKLRLFIYKNGFLARVYPIIRGR